MAVERSGQGPFGPVLHAVWRVAYEQRGENWFGNGLADRFGWPIRRLVNARRRLIQTGEVRPLTKPSQGKPVVYVWRGHGKQ